MTNRCGTPAIDGASPVANTTTPGSNGPGSGPDGAHAPVVHVDVEHLDAGGDAPGREAPGVLGGRVQRMQLTLVGEQHAAGERREVRLDGSHPGGVEHLEAGHGPGRRRERVGERDETVEPADAQRAVPALVERPPPGEARTAERDERRRVGPLVERGAQQRGGAAGGAGAQPGALDDDDPEAGVVARERGREPDEAATDDQHVGCARQRVGHAGFERGVVGGVERVAPDRVGLHDRLGLPAP